MKTGLSVDLRYRQHASGNQRPASVLLSYRQIVLRPTMQGIFQDLDREVQDEILYDLLKQGSVDLHTVAAIVQERDRQAHE